MDGPSCRQWLVMQLALEDETLVAQVELRLSRAGVEVRSADGSWCPVDVLVLSVPADPVARVAGHSFVPTDGFPYEGPGPRPVTCLICGGPRDAHAAEGR